MALYEPYYQTTTAPNEPWLPPPLGGPHPGAPELTELALDYQPELRRIADALEKLVRPAIGFTPHPAWCVVCESEGELMQEGFILGYGSAHDGEWVCAACIHRLVDAEVLRLEET